MDIKTLQEVARLKSINEATLRSAANDERIPAHKSSKVWLLDLDNPAVIAYIEGLKPKAKKAEKPNCLICGKEVPRQRAKYCSKECYGKSMQP